MMNLSIKIMVLKQHIENKPEEKESLLFLTDGYFERFHKLIIKDKDQFGSNQYNFTIEEISNI